MDVASLLEIWPQDACNPSLVQESLQLFSKCQSPEAEAICNLLPIGFPYQYNLPASFAKFKFYTEFLVRVLSWKLLPWFFYPPVVFQVTTAPPLKYTTIR